MQCTSACNVRNTLWIRIPLCRKARGILSSRVLVGVLVCVNTPKYIQKGTKTPEWLSWRKCSKTAIFVFLLKVSFLGPFWGYLTNPYESLKMAFLDPIWTRCVAMLCKCVTQ